MALYTLLAVGRIVPDKRRSFATRLEGLRALMPPLNCSKLWEGEEGIGHVDNVRVYALHMLSLSPLSFPACFPVMYMQYTHMLQHLGHDKNIKASTADARMINRTTTAHKKHRVIMSIMIVKLTGGTVITYHD